MPAEIEIDGGPVAMMDVAGRRGVDDVVVLRLVQRLRQLQQRHLQHVRQQHDLIRMDFREVRRLPPRHDRHLEREPRRKRAMRHEPRVLVHQPHALLDFLFQDVLEDAAVLVRVILHRPHEFFLQPLRRDRRRDQLRMRMADGRARLFAKILEDQNVPEPRVAQQIGHAHLVRLDHPRDAFHRLLLELQARVRRLDDDLVRADAVHLVVDPLPFLVEFALDAQGRELVRHHPHLPAGAVRFALRIAKGEDLRRRHVLVALGERVFRRVGHFHGLRHEIARPFPAFRGDDDPTAYDWILA